ncbi:MAG: orotate phosphoribosyltransferase [Gammaproteobacteria bacterium]
MSNSKEQLREMIDRECLTVGSDFELSTGQSSAFYFDMKKVTLDGTGLALIADFILEAIEELPDTPTAIGGLTMGADFIVAGVILRANQTDRKTTQGSIVRKEPKKHGTRSKIEHELAPGTKIVVVDDVVTSGSSTIKACDEFIAAGYEIVGVLTLVDRGAGGLETLRKTYGHATALFSATDFPRVVEYLNRHGQSETAVA